MEVSNAFVSSPSLNTFALLSMLILMTVVTGEGALHTQNANISGNASSATHKRNAHGAIFSIGGTTSFVAA